MCSAFPQKTKQGVCLSHSLVALPDLHSKHDGQTRQMVILCSSLFLELSLLNVLKKGKEKTKTTMSML
jgi:hypothetical protein